MKTSVMFLFLFMFVLAFGSGCFEREEKNAAKPLYEGVVWTLQWTDTNGKTNGMSRSSVAESVPGGNGSFDMDIYAHLYPTHIEITNRRSPELGPMIIFTEKLDFVQFWEGEHVSTGK